MKTELKVGDKLRVRVDDESKWTDEWVEETVESIAVYHGDPIVYVSFAEPCKIRCINYGFYCDLKAIKFPEK